MKISYEWLSSYFDSPLPSPKELGDVLSAHVCEVESIEDYEGDAVLDVKILPDRAPYMLSHRGIAREISAITGIAITSSKKAPSLEDTRSDAGVFVIDSNIEIPQIHIDPQTNGTVRRVTARRIEGIQGETPVWMKRRLAAVGQRSIFFLVDVSNYIMLDIGQPMHMFDADLIQGVMVARMAKEGETIEALSGEVYTLNSQDIVFADDEGLLDIAGVKGGKRTEVSAQTSNIIAVSANFSPSHIRKTSVRLNLRSDASKRFENNVPAPRALDALCRATEYIVQVVPESRVGAALDAYPEPVKPWALTVDLVKVADRIGRPITPTFAEQILKRMDADVQTTAEAPTVYTIIPHYDRPDMQHEQDIADEMGRIAGYASLQPILPPALENNAPHDSTFVFSEIIKDVLVSRGMSEFILYSLVPKGAFSIVYPLAKDKAALRESLRPLMKQSLITNARNADLLMQDRVVIFEIGKVFTSEGEGLKLAIGSAGGKKKGSENEQVVRDALRAIGERMGNEVAVGLYTVETGEFGAIAELDLDVYFSHVSAAPDYAAVQVTENKLIRYVPFSPYPFSSRDIAVFVPAALPREEVAQLIKDMAGPLCVRFWCFDIFQKNIDGVDMTSYAFRMVFQSFERTLEESDIQPIMDAMYEVIRSKSGWILR